MPVEISAVVAIGGAIISGLVGVISGVAVGAWWLSSKNEVLAQLVQKVAKIEAQCPEQHRSLQVALKDAVCAGFKLALKQLGNEFDKSQAAQDQEIAVLKEKMEQAEADIESLFSRASQQR